MAKTLPISEVKARLPELVTGVEERASCGPADPDTVEGGAAILGVDHAPRIGTASSDWLRDSRGHTDDVDLDPPIRVWNAGRTK